MKLTQIDLAEGRGGSQREMPASEAVARAEEACGGTLLLFEPDGVPRAAVAICPGGGFGKVNTEHEGVAFAEWFVAHGIAAGVVKYRLPEGDPALPQQDVERAAELLRNRFGGVKTGVLGASIGGYLAARHLLSLGHRRIACVVGPHATQMDSEARYHGYCRAMEEAGIPVDERLVCAGEYTQEGGAAAVEKLISQDFTAIFACNDASAYGVCRKLKEYRKKVPEDVSVVGYDDVFYARMLEVPLTTIRQQVREMGREAVRLLLKQIREHKRPESKVIFAPELVVRESTARIQPSQ